MNFPVFTRKIKKYVTADQTIVLSTTYLVPSENAPVTTI